MTTIRLEDIHKSYGRLEVLRGISLEIRSGQITSIVGPSGAGKTTLLQIMGTLDNPDSGRVLYDDLDVTILSDKRLSAFRNRHTRICLPIPPAAAGIHSPGECDAAGPDRR